MCDTDEHASDLEVEAAIRNLHPADFVRLHHVADLLACSLVGLGLGVSSDDLLQEAIVRTLGGNRRWRLSVTFVNHLIATMRSIANHTRDELKTAIVVDRAHDESSPELFDGWGMAPRAPDPREIAMIRQLIKQMLTRSADPPEVQRFIECLLEGMSGQAIQRELGIGEDQYQAIMTRLRRRIRDGIRRKP